MGKVCEMCVLAGFTFPRTCRRPSFEFPPPPLRDCTLVRNEAHFDPPQKKVFLPLCWHFSSLLPVFIITREPRSHETRQHPGLPFRSSPWNVLFAMLPGNSLKTRPTKARSTLSRAKQRHSFSLPSLSTLCPASFRKFVQRILSREYSENQGAYFLLQICRDTCRCCARWQDGSWSHVSWRNETQIYIYFVCRNWISHGCVTLIHCIDSC